MGSGIGPPAPLAGCPPPSNISETLIAILAPLGQNVPVLRCEFIVIPPSMVWARPSPVWVSASRPAAPAATAKVLLVIFMNPVVLRRHSRPAHPPGRSIIGLLIICGGCKNYL